MQTVSLTAGEHAALLLLVRSAEVEAAQVGAAVDVATAHAHQLVALADDLIYRLVGLNVCVALVHIRYLDRLAHFEGAGIGLFQAHYHAEEGRLAGAVGTDDAHDAARRKHEVEVLYQRLLAESLADAVCLDDLVAQSRPVGDEDFELFLALLLLLVEQFVVAVQTRLALCLTCLGRHAHPFQLAFQRLAALACHLLFLLHALRLLLEPRGVVALPGNAFASVEFENPACHVVEEVAVVRHGDDRAFVLCQVLFEPVNAFGIQMVGRLVEQQHVGLLQEQAAESYATAFATAQLANRLVGRRTAKGIHSPFQLAVEVPGVGAVDDVLQLALPSEELVHLVLVLVVLGQAELLVYLFVFLQGVHDVLYAFLHHLDDRLVVVELGFLLQVAHAVARAPHHVALILLLDAGNNLHQRRFARAVHAHDAYLGTVEEAEVDVLEDLLLILLDDFAHPDHREDDLLVVCCCHI